MSHHEDTREFIAGKSDACRVPVSRGFFSLVDPEDFEFVMRLRWRLHGTRERGIARYARATLFKDGKRIGILMHRLLLNPPAELQVDHINGDGLDNRRENLRICTASQNCANKRSPALGRSGYRGVYAAHGTAGYVAMLCNKQVGFSLEKIEAARIYDLAAIKKYGDFATLNFPRYQYERIDD